MRSGSSSSSRSGHRVNNLTEKCDDGWRGEPEMLVRAAMAERPILTGNT